MRDLRGILEHPTGRTVMTTIQKFQEITGAGGPARRGAIHPTLSEAANIFVMVDEAHRTQYKSLAANMRQALPNACFLGFTGTPIDKKDAPSRTTPTCGGSARSGGPRAPATVTTGSTCRAAARRYARLSPTP